MAGDPDPTALRRESAGRYRSVDGRFTVQAAGAGWLVSDAEQADDLGLPLARGPFTTLSAARDAMAAARVAPAPVSSLAGRGQPRRPPTGPSRVAARPPEAPIVVRVVRASDAGPLRAFWASIGMASLGDDDDGIRRLVERNPGLSLLALRSGAVVASALAGWDGRRGWLYHVAVDPGLRRRGVGLDLVRRIEARLTELGARRVNAVVRDDEPDAAAFWAHIGYVMTEARQYRRDLGAEGD
jgi:ribosomal protein S18 acetylase RimI-like enzyme